MTSRKDSGYVPTLREAIEGRPVTVTFGKFNGVFTAIIVFSATSVAKLEFAEHDDLETVLRAVTDEIYQEGYPPELSFRPAQMARLVGRASEEETASQG